MADARTCIRTPRGNGWDLNWVEERDDAIKWIREGVAREIAKLQDIIDTPDDELLVTIRRGSKLVRTLEASRG